jgi:uncharacterized short protein YbdD (DUF466 family)
MIKIAATYLEQCWRVFRTLTGDDAYEQYCAHHKDHHAHEPQLNRRDFYAKNLQEKWNGVRRCC